MKNFLIKLLLIGFLVLASCTSVQNTEVTGEAISIKSARNTDIPAVLTLPTGNGKFPIVIMCHGHGGSKDEAGGFISLSRALAKYGIASIRMDFPGCGDSSEDFVTQNNISNMLNDIKSVKNFIAEDQRLDMSKLGIIGYSMGGRLAMLTAGSDESFKAVVLWAPAAKPGADNMFTFMQCDLEGFNALYDRAKRDGRVTYTAIFGFDQTLGRKWFDDMFEYDPLTVFAGFKNDALTIYGNKDIIIPPDAAKEAALSATNAKSSILFEVKGADHGFGIYSEEKKLTMLTIGRTVKFMKDKLK